MNNDSLWKLVFEVEAAVIKHYQPIFDRFCDTTGLDSPMVGLLLEALSFDTEASSPSRLSVRNPYTAINTLMARLWVTEEKGFMIEGAPGEYRLTAIGRARTEDLIHEAREAMAKADPLPPGEADKLAHLLVSLVQSSLNTPPPPEPWALHYSYKLMPPPSPPLPYIDQAISCLHNYRDDAHLAAWQKTGLSAIALETLTLLWRGEVDSLEAICQRLARRGHSPPVYSHALEDLRERGFVEGPDSAPQVTSAGKAFREEVEEDTDRLFFAPWGILSEAQREEMAGLLLGLRDGLNGRG